MESLLIESILKIVELEKIIQEKDKQIQSLEQVILRLEAFYGIPKEKVFKAREDVLFPEDKTK